MAWRTLAQSAERQLHRSSDFACRSHTSGLGDIAEQGAEFRLYDAEDSARPVGEFLARFTILAIGPAGGPWSS